MPACVLELAGLPHAVFDLAYFFLILEEEARGFAVARNLSGEGQITNMFKCRIEPVEVVSAELETPEIVLGIPWVLSLIMVRDCIQWSSVLRVVSGDNADDVRIWSHNDSSIVRWNAPPPVVSDDARYIVDPTIEIKT